MMIFSLFHRLRRLVLLSLIWVVAACELAATPSAIPGVVAQEAKTPTVVASPSRQVRFVLTPTPRPTPTPTPQPLARPDLERAAELTRKGEALFLESDLAGAEAAFIDAIAAAPNHLPAHIGLTRVYLYQPQYWQQALASAQATAALAPDDPVVLAHLAWAQQQAHHFDEARSTALRAVELGPENALAHAALADVLISVYEAEAALDHARRAVELDEQSAVAWAILGNAEAVQHNWEAARAAYDRARELEPTFFAWHLTRAEHELETTGDIVSAHEIAAPALRSQPKHAWSLGFLLDEAIEKRDWETAVSLCERSMELDQPHTPYPDPYMNLAGVMILQERFDEAEHYQELAERRATAYRRDVSLIRMRLYLERDECQKARALAEEWLKERPYSIVAMRMVGMSYLCERDYEQAIRYFRRAYEALPRSTDSIRFLAMAYAHADKAAEAMALLNEAATFALDDPNYYQALYETHMGLGNYREALRAAQRWQAMRPNDTQPRVSLAMVHLLSGNVAAALWAGESALAAGERSATLYAVLGQAAYRQGDMEKAEEYLVRAVEQNENNYLAREFLATFYVSQGKCEKAVPHLRWLLERTTDEEEIATLKQAITLCERRTAPLPTPHPSVALSDAAGVEEARAVVRAAGAEERRIELTETKEGHFLVVSYLTELEADSEGFAELERRVAMDLARLLPRFASQPDGLVLISTSGERSHLTIIETWAAVLWVNGELDDEQFEATWHRQWAPGSTG